MHDLGHLMAAYVHQDWWDEYDGSWRAAVADHVDHMDDLTPRGRARTRFTQTATHAPLARLSAALPTIHLTHPDRPATLSGCPGTPPPG